MAQRITKLHYHCVITFPSGGNPSCVCVCVSSVIDITNNNNINSQVDLVLLQYKLLSI